MSVLLPDMRCSEPGRGVVVTIVASCATGRWAELLVADRHLL
jgi:hypothetical protein